MTLGLTDGTNNSGLSNHNDHYLEDFQGLYGKAIATKASGSKILKTNVGLGITTNSSKSGLIALLSGITLGIIPSKKFGHYVIKY